MRQIHFKRPTLSTRCCFGGGLTVRTERAPVRLSVAFAGARGYCVASHGRSQFGPMYYKTARLHSKTPYLPQTLFTERGRKKRLGPVPNPAFRFQARSSK